MRAHLRYLWPLCALMFWTGLARADAERPTVAVIVDSCVPVDHAKLQRLLAIELVGARIDPTSADTRVTVDCAERGIRLHLEDLLTRKSMQRWLPAASFEDPSSTRLLAVATAEFVIASWVELRVHRPATLALTPPQSRLGAAAERIATEHVEGASDDADTTLEAGFLSRVWTEQQTPLFGANLRWFRPVAAYLALTASGEVESGRARAKGGSISAVTASLAFAVALYGRIDRVELSTGPGASIGLANLDGNASDAALRGYHFTAIYAGPLWVSRVGYRVGPRLRVSLAVEAGLTTLPVHGTSQGAANALGQADVFTIDGLSLAASLGLGLAL